MIRVAAVLCLVALVAPACSNDTSTPVSPTFVPATSFTFASAFTANGSATRSFDQIGTGTVAMTLTSASPTVPLGIGVGIPRVGGTGCNLTRAVTTLPGGSPQISLTAEPGTWCVRVWDPGTVTDRVSFSLSVTHN